jgi:hypothetical protein
MEKCLLSVHMLQTFHIFDVIFRTTVCPFKNLPYVFLYVSWRSVVTFRSDLKFMMASDWLNHYFTSSPELLHVLFSRSSMLCGDEKSKMATLTSDWLRYFQLFLKTILSMNCVPGFPFPVTCGKCILCGFQTLVDFGQVNFNYS